MKKIINGNIYDSESGESLAEYDHRSHSNNYSGTSTLKLTGNGNFFVATEANGQDCYLTDCIKAMSKSQAREWLDGVEVTDEQETRLKELGLIKEA